jgi:hypothetical protein
VNVAAAIGQMANDIETIEQVNMTDLGLLLTKYLYLFDLIAGQCWKNIIIIKKYV